VKVYNSAISPFGARVVIAARAKGIGLETLKLPPEWRMSAEIRAVNPIIKIPILIEDDGTALPESETILRYLEDRFPEPTLLPATAEHRAQMNLLIRITDLYVSTPMIRLFPHLDPATRDERVVEGEVAHWRSGLANLAWFMERPLDLGDMLAPHGVIGDFCRQMEAHSVVGPVLAELTAAQAAMH
jgi:glutathione S-transferase